MPEADATEIEAESIHPTLPVQDVMRAVEHYTRVLGFHLDFTWGEPVGIAGVSMGKAQLFLEQRGVLMPGHVVSIVVPDVDAVCARHRERGATIAQELRDEAWGMRDYTVRDLDGHYLVFGQHTFRTGPPVPIERVAVHVRLEKRLAALLAELAATQRTSVGGMLEEIFLHTNDGALPHTASTLARIQRLKEKHGIDYDTHACYRFEEDSQ